MPRFATSTVNREVFKPLSSQTSTAKCLVTGGAGYIGSHVVKALTKAGCHVVVLDNLTTGFAWAVGDADLVVGDVGDRLVLEALFEDHDFDAVLHFAGHIWVGESVRNPAKYYQNNVTNALNLFEAAARHSVPHVVFSSTAAIYGEPGADLLTESLPSAPINPYGASKMMAERILADIAAASDMTFCILRYFNVAGADPEAKIGEATPDNQHIIKIACETALGLRPAMHLHGTDYPTPDGTCVRDYIHVEDLARAHLDALDYLREGGQSTICNCGYGYGRSNRQVIEMVKEVSGWTSTSRKDRAVPAIRRTWSPATARSNNFWAGSRNMMTFGTLSKRHGAGKKPGNRESSRRRLMHRSAVRHSRRPRASRSAPAFVVAMMAGFWVMCASAQDILETGVGGSHRETTSDKPERAGEAEQRTSFPMSSISKVSPMRRPWSWSTRSRKPCAWWIGPQPVSAVSAGAPRTIFRAFYRRCERGPTMRPRSAWTSIVRHRP